MIIFNILYIQLMNFIDGIRHCYMHVGKTIIIIISYQVLLMSQADAGASDKNMLLKSNIKYKRNLKPCFPFYIFVCLLLLVISAIKILREKEK